MLTDFFSRHLNYVARRDQSSWLKGLALTIGDAAVVDEFEPKDIFMAFIQATRDGQNLPVIKGIMQAAFKLLDDGSERANRNELQFDSDSSHALMSPDGMLVESAKSFLIRLLTTHRIVGSDLITGLLERIESCFMRPSGLPSIELIQKFAQSTKTREILLQHKQLIMVRIRALGSITQAIYTSKQLFQSLILPSNSMVFLCILE